MSSAAGASAASGAELPARSRGVIGLLEENCTVCMLCARECPDWCIYIESHKEPMPAEPGTEPRRGGRQVRNALDRFAIDFSLCMYCGICIEVCPYDALFWSPEFSYAETDIRDLTHERGRLRDWMWTVPPPPAHDPGAPVAKEVQAVYGPDGVPGAGSVAGAGGAWRGRRRGGAGGVPGADGVGGCGERVSGS